ncbi:hypothetical protein GCM10009647_033840 [Streptomyces sanglieri]
MQFSAFPRIIKAWADTGYRTKAIDRGVRLGIDAEVTRRFPTGAAGTVPFRQPPVVGRRHASFLDAAQRLVEDAKASGTPVGRLAVRLPLPRPVRRSRVE